MKGAQEMNDTMNDAARLFWSLKLLRKAKDLEGELLREETTDDGMLISVIKAAQDSLMCVADYRAVWGGAAKAKSLPELLTRLRASCDALGEYHWLSLCLDEIANAVEACGDKTR